MSVNLASKPASSKPKPIFSCATQLYMGYALLASASIVVAEVMSLWLSQESLFPEKVLQWSSLVLAVIGFMIGLNMAVPFVSQYYETKCCNGAKC